MKILTIHADYLKFQVREKAIKNAEETDKKEHEIKECLIVFTAVEKKDENDLKEIASKLAEEIALIANQVKTKNIVLYPYAHLSSDLAKPEHAFNVLKEAESLLKKKYKITRAPFGYYKSFELKCKGHPLSELSREINLEEKEKRVKQIKEQKIILDRRNLPANDHRIIGEDLNIFHISDDVGPELPLWLPKGETIRNQLMQYMREVEEKYGYQYVSTPHITKGKLYEKTGHLPYYNDTMYPPLEIEGIPYYLKPMNCPHHHMIFQKIVKSYRDLPLKLAEAGMTYRKELSGVTYGLIRTLCFTQNYAHIYLTQKQLKEEFIKVLEMFDEVYEVMGLKNYWFRLSLPDFKKNPEKYTGDLKEWEFASEEIKKAMKEYGKKFVEEKGEAAFYGPKIDVQIKNNQGKEETLATIQVDIVVPERLHLTYMDEKSEKKTPIVIHRAILGSYERFVAFLIEQTEGKLPFWLSPIQVRLINFTDRNLKFSQKVREDLQKELPHLRIDSDFRQTTVNDKIRDSELQKIPYTITIGDKEEQNQTLAVRERGKKPVFGVKLEAFVKEVKEKIAKKQ
ncbi:threonine--tRNA ligase [Candidatus Woesearchaeota archaeon]|nr:threonine--tRNA ligase [Candidatus Woesearchaeota archaeon]